MLLDDNPAVEAADLHNYAETGQSMSDSASDFITKGVPLAIGSGLVGIANTAVSLGNTLGGDFEKIDYDKEVQAYDDDLSKYYQQNKDGVDLGGFVATSFIPGLGGMKALKMIQSGVMGKSAAAVTGFFKNKEAAYLEKALSTVQMETNQVFKALDANKLAGMAAGFGEQTLQAAAFETGVMLSMNQHPVINKEDQSYFESLMYNTPEILKSALIGGAIGGGINAISIGGKIKSAIRERDSADFPSLRLSQLGLSDVDDGTKAALDFYFLKNREREYKALADAGKLEDRQVQNFEKTQKQKATELLTRIREDLTDDKDADLAKSVWNHLQADTAHGSDSAEDVALRILGAATKIERITLDDSTQLMGRVYYHDLPLSERHTKNILERAKEKNTIAPGTIQLGDEVSMEEARLAGYEMYRAVDGKLKVLPGTDYAKQTLNKALDTRKHDFIVKLSGQDAGRITTTAYPILGDLGKVRFDKGKLFLEGQEVKIPQYNPLENSPIDSANAFLREKNLPDVTIESGTLEISADNLPRLEKLVSQNYTDVLIKRADGSVIAELDKQTLTDLKLEMRASLMAKGHSFDQIAREINVSQQFAETGRGEMMLSQLEDHMHPLHGKFNYDTQLVPDKNYLRGVNDLMTRVKIAREHNEKVATFILGDAWNELIKSRGTLTGINTTPELGNFVKAADEMYGSTGQVFQHTGRIVEREIRRRVDETISQISAYHNEIQGDETLLRDFNLLLAKVRSSKEPVDFLPGLNSSGETWVGPKRILKEMTKKDGDYEGAFEEALQKGEVFQIKQQTLANYLEKTKEINGKRVNQYNAFFAAKGSITSWDPDQIYLPPINTRKYPFVAFVRDKAELEFRPTSVITASDASSLEAKIRSVRQEFGDSLGVYTKDDLENYYRMQGEYESGLLLGNSTVDNALKKRGHLSDFLPRTDDEILKDFVNWHVQAEQALVRNGIELQYAQEFAELRSMGVSFKEYQKSKFGGRELTAKEEADIRKDNPYEKYIQTALAVSNYTKYDSVWGRFNSGVEGLGQSMFKIWDSLFQKANKGQMDWSAANKEAESLGFRPPFANILKEIINPVVADKKIIEPIVQKVNSALAAVTLRLDPLNSIVNMFGTPALMAAELRNISKNLSDPARVGELSKLLNVTTPDGKYQIPSTMKAISDALGNFIKDDGTLLKYYQDIGAVHSDLQLYKNVMDASVIAQDTLDGGAKTLTAWANNVVSKAAEVGTKLSGNALSERMVRFVAADVMRQIGETAGLGKPELAAYINTFVNRVHGNYVASQRPALFQGAVGQAISLFQTYQFNVMQNMVRFIEQNDKMSVASLLGLQNTLFGLQGNPAFYLMNSYIGNANREHKDLISGVDQVVGPQVGNWLLYGLGSNALKTNLYNRGDLTPRYVTVVPTTFTDVPAISIPAKIISNFLDTMGAIAHGGSVKQSLLEGLGHNGANRPLAGLAQLAQGYRTTNNGNMLVAYNDLDTVASASKIVGGEEMNRAMAIDAYYRNVAYKKKDLEKIGEVGQAVKNKIRSGEPIEDTDIHGFMSQYSRAGGRIDSFNRFMVDQYKNANTSQVKKMQSAVRTPFSKNLASIMGAEDDSYLTRQVATPAEEAAAQ